MIALLAVHGMARLAGDHIPIVQNGHSGNKYMPYRRKIKTKAARGLLMCTLLLNERPSFPWTMVIP